MEYNTVQYNTVHICKALQSRVHESEALRGSVDSDRVDTSKQFSFYKLFKLLKMAEATQPMIIIVVEYKRGNKQLRFQLSSHGIVLP